LNNEVKVLGRENWRIPSISRIKQLLLIEIGLIKLLNNPRHQVSSVVCTSAPSAVREFVI